MKELNKILIKHLGADITECDDYKALKKDLKAWHNQPLNFSNKTKKINNLIKVINISFCVDCTQASRQHVYIAARLCFYTCIKKLYPLLSKKETVAYVGMKQHGTLSHAVASQRSFFNTYPRFKAPYNRVAKRYNIEKV